MAERARWVGSSCEALGLQQTPLLMAGREAERGDAVGEEVEAVTGEDALERSEGGSVRPLQGLRWSLQALVRASGRHPFSE